VQRKFYDITVLGDAPIATQALLRIGKLYKIEDEIRGSTPKVRRATRQVESKAIIDELVRGQLEACIEGLTTRRCDR
jgi:transposase